MEQKIMLSKISTIGEPVCICNSSRSRNAQHSVPASMKPYNQMVVVVCVLVEDFSNLSPGVYVCVGVCVCVCVCVRS